ncbi:MAG: ATP-binding protein [Fibrobacter sp.]|nr:ATP-binding protein [Fibrobacter sp.]
MAYFKRTLETAIKRMNASFPVVMVTGPRQVGKTTVLRNCDPDRRYVSLDKLELRILAQENPDLFLQRFPPPVLIDEVHHAPQLLPYIKAIVDEKREKGLFWLTGSQQFRLMRGVSESLAGRVGILQLQGFSIDELRGRPDVDKFVPTAQWIQKRTSNEDVMNYGEVFERIWRGSYPALYENPQMDWEDFYSSYIQTYIERDIRELINVGEEIPFTKFITAVASRTGQLLNYSDIAKDIGKNVPTVQRWLSLLVASGLVYLLYPYAQSIGNRMTKMPKVYFLDTGLACYLTRWSSPAVLEAGAKSGEMLETFVVSEALKTYWHNGRQPNFSFYRDKEKREIDLIVEDGGLLYPVEIKKTSNPTKNDIRHFDILEKNGLNVGEGAVICLAQMQLPLTGMVHVLPLSCM